MNIAHSLSLLAVFLLFIGSAFSIPRKGGDGVVSVFSRRRHECPFKTFGVSVSVKVEFYDRDPKHLRRPDLDFTRPYKSDWSSTWTQPMQILTSVLIETLGTRVLPTLLTSTYNILPLSTSVYKIQSPPINLLI